MASKPPFDFSRKAINTPTPEKLVPAEPPTKREAVDETEHFMGMHTCHYRTLAQAVPAGYDMAGQSYFWDQTKPVEEGKEAPVFPPLVRAVSIIASSPAMCALALKAIQSVKEELDVYNLSEAVDPIKKPFATDWFTALVHVDGTTAEGVVEDIVYGIFDFNEEPNVLTLRNRDYGGGMIGSLRKSVMPFLPHAETSRDSALMATVGYPAEDIVVYSIDPDGIFQRQYYTGEEASKFAASVHQLAALRIAKPQGTV